MNKPAGALGQLCREGPGFLLGLAGPWRDQREVSGGLLPAAAEWWPGAAEEEQVVTWRSTKVLAFDWSSKVLQRHQPKTITGGEGHHSGSEGWDHAGVPRAAQAVLRLQLWVSTRKTRGSRVPLPDVKGWGGVSAVETRL